MNADIIKLVVAILGFTGLACVTGMAVLAGIGKEPPAALVSLASASIGALVGILAVQRENRP